MKLAHIADAHLGIRQYYRQTPAGINQREADVAQAFRAAIDGVIAARPDAIVVAGPRKDVTVPPGAAVVDVTGTYIVPGLFDVFATQNNQAQANAHLYMGVTSIVGLEDLTPKVVLVTVRFPWIDKSGNEIGGETSTYTLKRDTTGALRVRASVMHGAE